MKNRLEIEKKSHPCCDNAQSLAQIPRQKEHPDHTSSLVRLKKIKGQINGLEKMIEEKRYCVDILVQFRAIASALKAIEMSILNGHIQNCVQDAMRSKSKTEIQQKADELIRLMSNRF
jgi:DNA-binding FrmR family transcriptional regulator